MKLMGTRMNKQIIYRLISLYLSARCISLMMHLLNLLPIGSSLLPERAKKMHEQVKVIHSHLSSQKLLHHCQCGVFNVCCRNLATIYEHAYTAQHEKACKIIQKLGRRYICKWRMKLILMKKAQLRRDVCTDFYERNVLRKIWAKVDHAFSIYRESREPPEMAIEENLRRKYDYYYNLQGAFQVGLIYHTSPKSCLLTPINHLYPISIYVY